ncbi:MAG TPA: hypothetical protein VGH17_06010 [Candidatus Acidoferrales bacterium]|jgi:hypothetical protein
MRKNQTARKLLTRGNARLAWSLLAILGTVLLFSFARATAKEVSALEALQDATSSTPKLAGHWQLNKDQSDDVRQKMQAARGDSGGGQAEGSGGGRGQGGREGAGRAQRAGMMDDLQTLAIEQTGSNVKITGKSGRVLAQYPSNDSSAEKNSAPEGEGQRTTTSQWQNGQLVAVTQSPRGKSTRTYSLSPDGKQLYVTTKMENERLKEPVTYRFVYDPVSSASN